MKLDLAALREKLSSTLAGFTLGQKVVTVLAAIGLLVGGMLVTSWSSSTQYGTLFANLDPTDASTITTELTSRKIPYHLEDGGKTISVPQGEVYQLRIDLSGKGLPSGGNQGYALLDKQGITTSEFRQRVDYQRALEGELSRTIGAIDGVQGATVHLVIPKSDIFSEDSTKPTASVLEKTAPGAVLHPASVQAIVHLVSASVEGLNADDVTVADAKGRVLSTPGDDGATSAAADARTQKTTAFNDQLSNTLTDLVATVVGQGRAKVQVSAVLDFDQRSQTAEKIDTTQPPTVVGESSSKETLTGPGASAAVPASGVLGSTTVPPAGGTATTQAGTYNKEDAQKQYAVGKVTEQVKAAPGAVTRLSVSVLLDANSPGASDTTAIQKLVTAAAGLDPKRGDTIAVERLGFDQSAKDDAAKELKQVQQAKAQEKTLGLVRQLATLGIVALVLLLALRSARKALKPVRTPLEPAELERVRSTMALPPGDDEDAAEPSELPELALVTANVQPQQRLIITPETPAVEREVAQLLEQQPEEVATLLRGWLNERR
jgi:flagellar M-ring protein FliF